jgi:hypothetical protein
MQVTRRTLLMAPLIAAPALLLARTAASRPLWPGSRFTDADKARAIAGGVRFMDGVAKNPEHFAEWGSDLLWWFYTLATLPADPALRRIGRQSGRERAMQWRRANPVVPVDADIDTVIDLVSGSYSSDLLGVRDERMKRDLRRAARRFSAKDYFGFDPTREAVPSNIPEDCDDCSLKTPEAKRDCDVCRAKGRFKNPYDVICDAAIMTYNADRYGVKFGARLADVLQWLPRLRPYPSFKESNLAFFQVAYAITHVIYVLNDYSASRLRPEWLPEEFEFLKAHLPLSIAADDSETMGEFLDTLKSFGLTESDPLLASGIEFVLSKQNPDGSWGDTNEEIYTRYHTTWTAVNGLTDYGWPRGVAASYPEALRRARGP